MFRKAATVVVLVALAGVAHAQTFTMTLLGERETPIAGDPDGAGLAVIEIDGTTIWYYMLVKGIETPTASHVHTARSGQSGGVAIPLTGAFAAAGADTFVAFGSTTTSDTTVQGIVADPGAYYLNVHNGPFPGGALRGQLLGDGPAGTAFATGLLGGREAPSPGDPDGSGFAAIVFDGATVHYYLRVEDIAAPTAAHIHAAPAGQSGGVVIGLSPTFTPEGAATGSVTASADVVDDILESPFQYYVNVHNADFPGGALRGQLAPTETTLSLPVAAHNKGLGTSFFRTDVRIQSLADVEATVWAEWYPTNTAGMTGPANVTSLDVNAGGVAILDDVVDTLFNTSARGAIRFLSNNPIHAVANTFNDQRSSGSGTFGQFAEALGPGKAYHSGSLPLASHHERATGIDYRFNVGYFNPNPFATNVTFNVRQPAGTLIASQVVTFPAYSNDVRSYYSVLTAVPSGQRTQDDFFITYSSDGPIYVFGSLIDNKTDDGLHQAALPIPAPLVQPPGP